MLQDHFKTILSVVCSETEHLTSNATHHIFRLHNDKEARIATDILNTTGFEVKLYNDNDENRLYITKPKQEKEKLEMMLRRADSYAHALKNIYNSMENLASKSVSNVENFGINIMASVDNSQIITINIEQKKAEKQGMAAFSASEAPAKTVINETAPSPPNPQPMQKKQKKAAFDQMGAPAIAKTHLMQDENAKEKGAVQRWLYTNVWRHFINNSAEISVLVIFLLIVSALVVTSKAFLCPDFATAKSVPWYCDKAQIRKKFKEEEPPLPI